MAEQEPASLGNKSRGGSPEMFQEPSVPSSRMSPETLRSQSPSHIGAESSRGSPTHDLNSIGSDAATIEVVVSSSCDILDHRKVVSTLPHNPMDATGKKLQQYLVMSKLNVVKPSFTLKEGEYKKFGRMHKFSRNVYVAGYEKLDITLSNGKNCWTGSISYADHNVLRKRGGRDESWSIEKFLPLVQMTVQYPDVFDGLDVAASIERSKESKGLILKLKGMRNGTLEHFIKPCLLNIMPEDPDESKPKPPAKLFAETFNINNRHFLVACRTNNLDRAKMLIQKSKGNMSINYVDEFSGWSVLQYVCYHGYYDFANYMLIEHRETLLKDYISPHDGNTALHCAVMSGHVDLVRLLITFDVIPDFVNSNGETPPELALIKGHKNIVEYFYGDESQICIDGKRVYGVRNKNIENMFVYLKPERILEPHEWIDGDENTYEDEDDEE